MVALLRSRMAVARRSPRLRHGCELLAPLALAASAVVLAVSPRQAAWLQQPSRSSRVAMQAASKTFVSERSPVFVTCVEKYHPDDPSNEDFDEGPPPTGFRNLTEAIRPYHPNPEWMIFPEPVGSFERDQKICSMYTLATGLFKDINACIRADNEDGLRRLAPFIWEIREVLRFTKKTIATPQGRKCKPFMGRVLRGMDVPVEEAEKLAAEYKVGTEFYWPAFTSCQLEEGGLWPFDGNLNFEIECNIDPKTLKAEEIFAPVRISRFLGGSNEVLFPPFTKFKVVGVRDVERVTENEETRDVYTIQLEVVELPIPQAGKPGERRR